MSEPKGPDAGDVVLGTVFDIKRFATADGPGIRTLVFLKGCPLRCVWCANPESHHVEPEVMYHRTKCVGCGHCIDVCPEGVIHWDTSGGVVTDYDRCTACGRCVDACVYAAREMVGRRMEVSEVMRVIRRDRRHYDNSDGGVTVSGGEPLCQPEFTRKLLNACCAEGIHTAMETSGCVPWEALEAVLLHLDLLFFDLKAVDVEHHKDFTGVGNRRILGNLARVARLRKAGSLVVRIPCVPGYTEGTGELRAALEWLRDLEGSFRIELLPYHRLGAVKYEGLGRTYETRELEPLHRDALEQYRSLGEAYGLDIRIDAI